MTELAGQSQSEVNSDAMERAANFAKANVYSMGNDYLDLLEKQEVEMWYGLPGNAMFYAFVFTATYSVYNPISWSEILGVPVAINFAVGLINWYFYNKSLVYGLQLTLFHPWAMYLVGVGSAIFLLLNGAIALAFLALIMPFGLLVFAELHLPLYSFLARKYRMHPKFAFFKRVYGRVFPFEEAALGH